jgi:hypothetical protein
MTTAGKISALLILLLVASARAEDRLPQLERELDLYAAEGRRDRLWNGALALGLGGVLLPAGIVMIKRNDELVHLIGIGTLITGAVQFTRVPGLFLPSDMERLRAHHSRRKAEGMSGDALVRATEREWEQEARKEDLAQKWVGGIHLAVGAAAIPIGLTFMLRDHVGDMSHNKRINVGSTLLGIGIGYMAVAAQLLANDGRSEHTWKAHRLQFGIAPTASGGLMTASGRF